MDAVGEACDLLNFHAKIDSTRSFYQGNNFYNNYKKKNNY